MKQFESRNVLDRIETTWNMFFSSAWQVRVLPQIVFAALWTTLGMLSFAPLFFLFPSFMTWDTLDSAGQMLLLAKALMILLVPITIFTLVSGMMYTYTLTVSHDYEVGKTWKDYARIAWSRLWWWAWYGLWATLFMLMIFALWTVLYFLSSVIFGFAVVILVCIFFWGIVALYAGAPGYILANSWNPHGFFSLFSLTTLRWWSTFGNMILGSIVVSSMLSLIQQLIYWIMWIGSLGTQLAALEWKDNIDWTTVFSDLSPDFGTRFIFGAILLFILSGGQQVFVGMFQYVVWKDITTDVPEAATGEKKEE